MEVALQLTDNASLRGMEGHDGKWYFSVYDFINFVTGHEPSSSYARTLFCRLVKDGSEHANEIASNCSSFKIQGSRGSETPCMTIRGLQRLLMILGGKVAAEFREIVEGSRHSINFVTGHELGNGYAQKTFSRLNANDSAYAKEVSTNCRDLKFPGSGQKSTPCMTVRGLQRLLMILGGKVAAEFREIVEGSRHSSPWPHTHFTKANKKTNKTKALIQEHWHTRARWKLPCS
jgi:hypothetical protein